MAGIQKRTGQHVDPSWDVDWDKAEEEDKKKEAKEQARNDRKRKQEVEERAASKEANGHGLSATFISSPAAITCVYQAFDTCDTSSSISSSKLLKFEVQAKG